MLQATLRSRFTYEKILFKLFIYIYFKADGQQTSYGTFTYSDGTTTNINGGGTYGSISTFCLVDNAGTNQCYGAC